MKELYEPLPSVEELLERIGLPGYKTDYSVESLDILINAFLTHVPYENLEVSLEHKKPGLSTRELFDKIVTRKRGGYCFEMNGIMWALLRDLGFEVYSVVIFILAAGPELAPPSHRGNIVVIDGQKYYVDVGYGSKPIGMAIPLGGERGNFRFSFDGQKKEYTLHRNDVGEDGKVLMFRDYCAYIEEFVGINEWASASTTHPMAINRVCNIVTEDGGNYRLFGNSFKWKTREGTGERTIESEDDFYRTIKEYFGIEIQSKEQYF